MGRKSKYSKELKLGIVKRYLNGEGSTYTLAREINSVDSVVLRWIKKIRYLAKVLKTPYEVRSEALANEIPNQYPIPENKRIKKYKLEHYIGSSTLSA